MEINKRNRNDFVETAYFQIVRDGFSGIFHQFLSVLINSRLIGLNYDARWKEAKAFEAARSKVIEAAFEMDKAIEALKIKQGSK